MRKISLFDSQTRPFWWFFVGSTLTSARLSSRILGLGKDSETCFDLTSIPTLIKIEPKASLCQSWSKILKKIWINARCMIIHTYFSFPVYWQIWSSWFIVSKISINIIETGFDCQFSTANESVNRKICRFAT